MKKNERRLVEAWKKIFRLVKRYERKFTTG